MPPRSSPGIAEGCRLRGMRPDRRRDRGTARPLRPRRLRPGRLRGRRRGARRAADRRSGRAGRHRARPGVGRGPCQRLLAGPDAVRRSRPRLERSGAVRSVPPARGRAADADPDLRPQLPGRGPGLRRERRREGAGAHHRRRADREYPARPAARPGRRPGRRRLGRPPGLRLAPRDRPARSRRDGADLQLRPRHDRDRRAGRGCRGRSDAAQPRRNGDAGRHGRGARPGRAGGADFRLGGRWRA